MKILRAIWGIVMFPLALVLTLMLYREWMSFEPNDKRKD